MKLTKPNTQDASNAPKVEKPASEKICRTQRRLEILSRANPAADESYGGRVESDDVD
jgi:hypothetical protein